ncbi:MAG: secretin N-terminal domain-containing protein [Candidatus Krumholzibacteriia bacterium]
MARKPWSALAALTVLLAACPALAQQTDLAATVTVPADHSRPISLDVQDADIGTVLRSLASFSGTNIVASPRVQGKVTVKLEDVPWQKALGVILRAHSFDYVVENGIFRVDSADALRQERLAEKQADRSVADLEKLTMGMVTLHYANAAEVKGTLEDMLTSRGKIDVDTRTNAILINDIPERVAIMEDMALRLDTETPQVEINARLVDMDTRATRELGISWGIANFKPDGGNVVGSATVSSPVQDPSGDFRIGTVQSYGDLMAKLEAMQQNNKARLISNPVVTTADNREAKILVGQKIPLIVSDEAGNAITQLTTIGIQMLVTPHINSPDKITLDIHNEVSDLSSQATVQGGVIINTNEADTRVLVENGATAIIAGLIRDVESSYEKGVPVLKDIPLLGQLFKHTSRTRAERELVIFVTPRIITSEYLNRGSLYYGEEPLEQRSLQEPAFF